jgi:predicted O-methyltransferase YrrM
MTHAEAMKGISFDEGSISAEQAFFLSDLVETMRPKRVAETGFGIGWSAWAMLSVDPDLTVVSFDIGHHAGVHQAKAVIDEHFPGRHTLIVGDSKATVPVYQPKNFDLVFVDGGHDYESASADLVNFAHPGRVVVIDDLVAHAWAVGVVRAWAEATSPAPGGFIVQNHLEQDGDHRWAIGRYL